MRYINSLLTLTYRQAGLSIQNELTDSLIWAGKKINGPGQAELIQGYIQSWNYLQYMYL